MPAVSASVAEALAKWALRSIEAVAPAGTIRVAASLTVPGAGAGSSCRNVAARIRSSEPSSGARPTYSTRTQAVPLDAEAQQVRGISWKRR